MNRYFFSSFAFLIVALSLTAQNQSKFYTENVTAIHPTGWLQTLLQRQADGLTGHPEALSYPYNSCLWAGEISRNDETYGDNWWRYEQTAYYTDGMLRLGYELNNEAMVNHAMEGVNYTLTNVSEQGILGNKTLVGITWPMSVFFRVLQAVYEHDHDNRIIPALERHYLNFTADELAGGIVGGRNIMSLEGMLWTYGKTGNAALLKLAEDAWAIQNRFAVDETAITSAEPFYMHSVTFCEMLKLPLLLYAYTGKERYLELATTAIRKLESESMLPDGVPTSAEFLMGDNIHISHETCDVVDFTWTLSHFLTVTGQVEWADKIEKAIYNAGLGCITKDFRALQYFSSVNQFIATGTSNHNIYRHGSTWMAYRPTHETECCSGNVNRMLPNFVSRMWMTDKEGGAVAAIYGPSTASFNTDKGQLTISCTTNYPFEEVLTFNVSGTEGATLPLTLRIPTWCSNASLSLNGQAVNQALQAGTFVRMTEKVKAGDVVTLTLPMTVEKTNVEGQGIYFQRGPLLLAYPIAQKMTEDLTEYENMHGKKPENADFKCWNITPTGAFNYAYTANGQNEQYATTLTGAKGFPFDLATAPLKVRIPVKEIKWELEKNRYTPAQPEQGHLEQLSEQVKYIDLVPYGCTELRLTVFPDADAEPLPAKPVPDYSRPADAPACVAAVEGHYYAYFEEPRFCWDDPIYCKVRTADDTTTDMQSAKGGEECTMVGTTANGRKIWLWTGPVLSEKAPVELIFTNRDMLTFVMPFEQGGYYNFRELRYKTELPTGIVAPSAEQNVGNSTVFDLQGRIRTQQLPSSLRSVYIKNGKILLNR